MLIDKTEIERVKRANELVSFIRSRGVALTQRGKQLVGLCVFHPDTEASLIVDPKKQLWNCLGACHEGGDVYRFVMKADGVDFREAHRRLGGHEPEAKSVAVEDQQWLERAVAHYHARLLQTLAAQDYLRSRGITAAEFVTSFRIGYVEAGSAGILPAGAATPLSLMAKLPAEGRRALRRVGVLTGSGRELLRGCVVFPLVAAVGPHSGHVVGLYGRSIEGRRHLYLPGERHGIFNPQGAKNTDEVIITESIIDAAALWSAGLRNVIPTYGVTGLTDEIISHLVECRVKRVMLMLDADEAGRAAAQEMSQRLAAVNIEGRSVEVSAKDAAEFIAAGGTAEQIRAIIESAPLNQLSQELNLYRTAAPINTQAPSGAACAPTQTTSLQIETSADGSMLFTVDGREYRIRGLSPVGLERLRVNVRLTINSNFHLDTLDLYHARARAVFAQGAAKLCGVGEQQVSADLLQMIEKLEAARLALRKNGDDANKNDAPMTPAERDAALQYLKNPQLTECIVEDFRKCGLVGERATVLTAYLAAISRKLSEPLAVLIVARSGAGKSALQDALCAFVPPEEAVRVTRLTGQALFYKDPYSLQQKVLAIAEDEGALQAVYSLRNLASEQHLSIAATRTDPNTGKLHTEHYEVYGPVVIVLTTTSPEAFDEETRSRFVQLTMDESVEQTRAILERQRHRYTLAGVMEQATSEQVRRLHHNAQRLLRPLKVVNPFMEYLTYPAERLLFRREQQKYLSLMNAIALLHQQQRETKREVEGDVEVEYVEVTVEDVALANQLAKDVLARALDELAPPVRGMYEELRALCARRAEELKCDVDNVQLSRREIREATGWSDWQVRSYCQKLVELEYLYATVNGNGRPCVYSLARADDQGVIELRGLTDVEEIKRRLKEKAKAATG
ncbi:MAG: CHC2 zinc finger domain-containing protein [Pyrinomonadaceae bacterium]